MLVVRLSSFGSILHTLPAVTILRRRLPEVTVDWLVRSPYSPLVKRVRGLRRVWEWRGWRHWQAVRRDLRAQGYTWAIDFQGLFKSALWTWWSGASQRLGFRGRDLRERWGQGFYNRFPTMDSLEGWHVIEKNVLLLTGFGWAPEELLADLHTMADSHVRLNCLTEDSSGESIQETLPEGPFWVLQPGAGRPEKRWSVATYARLVATVFAQTRRPAVVLWGPRDVEQAQALMARVPPGAAQLAPSWGWEALVSVLCRAAVVVGPDTGVVHLADWVGTPVVMWVVRSRGGWVTAARNGPYFTRSQSQALEISPGVEPVQAVATAIILRLGSR